jgi:hypothetical protein
VRLHHLARTIHLEALLRSFMCLQLWHLRL